MEQDSKLKNGDRCEGYENREVSESNGTDR